MKNSAYEKEMSGEGCVHSHGCKTASQRLSPTHRFPTRLYGFDSRIPLFPTSEVNSQARQLGLLKAEPDRSVISESGFFISTPGGVVGEGDDSRCEPLANRGESKNLESITPSKLQRLPYSSSVLRKQAALLFSMKPLRSLKITNFGKSLFLWLILTNICLAGRAQAQQTAPNFNSFNCIRALVGEVEGENFLTKKATAECLRNRGNLKQVYGYYSKRIPKASKKVWEDSKKAWAESAHSDLTKGATVWGNAADVRKFKTQKWFRSYYQTAKVGGHYFFALRKEKNEKNNNHRANSTLGK